MGSRFESINKLVVFCMTTYNPIISYESACEVAIKYYPHSIIQILISETNEPSVYDLLIINAINHYSPEYTLHANEIKFMHRKILNLYKDRI